MAGPKHPHLGRSNAAYLHNARFGGRTVSLGDGEHYSLLALSFDPAIASIQRNDRSPVEREAWELPNTVDNVGIELPSGSTYHADLRIVLRAGVLDCAYVLAELGRTGEKAEPEMRAKLEAARIASLAQGVPFVVLVDEYAMENWLGANAELLFGYREAPIGSARMRERADEWFTAHPASVSDVAERLGFAFAGESSATLFGAAWSAVAFAADRARLTNDLRLRQLDAHTKIRFAPCGERVMPSYLLEQIETQRAEAWQPPRNEDPLPGIWLPSGVLLGPEDDEAWQTNLRMLQEQHDEGLTDAAVGDRYGLEDHQVRYLRRRYAGYGMDGVRPGVRVPSARSRLPFEYQAAILDAYYRPKLKQKVASIETDPDYVDAITALNADRRAKNLRTFAPTVKQMRQVVRHRPSDADREAIREGKDMLPLAPSPTTRSTYVQIVRPGQLWEIDGTDSDEITLAEDRATPVARSKDLRVIDVATRVAPGWLRTASKPSEFDVRKVIAMGMSPKTELCRRLGTRHEDFPFYCIPERIRWDNAWEQAARQIARDLLPQGIRLEWTPHRRPEKKARVERLHGTTHTLWLHTEAGTTGSNVVDRGDRDAGKLANSTWLEAEDDHSIFMIDVYTWRGHNGLHGVPPGMVWQQREARFGPAKIPDGSKAWRDWLEIFQTVLVEDRQGVRKLVDGHGFSAYNCWFRPQLWDLPVKCRLRANLDDVRRLYVCTLEGTYVCRAEIQLEGVDLSEPLSRWELKELLRLEPAARASTSAAKVALTELRRRRRDRTRLSPAQAARAEARVSAKRDAPKTVLRLVRSSPISDPVRITRPVGVTS